MILLLKKCEALAKLTPSACSQKAWQSEAFGTNPSRQLMQKDTISEDTHNIPAGHQFLKMRHCLLQGQKVGFGYLNGAHTPFRESHKRQDFTALFGVRIRICDHMDGAIGLGPLCTGNHDCVRCYKVGGMGRQNKCKGITTQATLCNRMYLFVLLEVPTDLKVLPVTKRIPTPPGSAVPTKIPKGSFEWFF